VRAAPNWACFLARRVSATFHYLFKLWNVDGEEHVISAVKRLPLRRCPLPLRPRARATRHATAHVDRMPHVIQHPSLRRRSAIALLIAFRVRCLRSAGRAMRGVPGAGRPRRPEPARERRTPRRARGRVFQGGLPPPGERRGPRGLAPKTPAFPAASLARNLGSPTGPLGRCAARDRASRAPISGTR
jgi:hypothetical protein